MCKAQAFADINSQILFNNYAIRNYFIGFVLSNLISCRFSGKFKLKIPWKNPWTANWEVVIDSLFLLVGPNNEVIYDPVKEEKHMQETKLAEIQKVEEAKKLEREKGKFTLIGSMIKMKCFVEL